jgi:hypothetical protein
MISTVFNEYSSKASQMGFSAAPTVRSAIVIGGKLYALRFAQSEQERGARGISNDSGYLFYEQYWDLVNTGDLTSSYVMPMVSMDSDSAGWIISCDNRTSTNFETDEQSIDLDGFHTGRRVGEGDSFTAIAGFYITRTTDVYDYLLKTTFELTGMINELSNTLVDKSGVLVPLNLDVSVTATAKKAEIKAYKQP